MFLEELASGKHLIVSYYYTASLTITLTLARLLRQRGEEVCIINEDRIRWNLAPFPVDLKCGPRSVNLVFDAMSESEVPSSYLLVTSSRHLRLPSAREFKLTRINDGIYMATGEGTKFLFKVSNAGVEDVDYEKSSVLSVLEDFGGTALLGELVDAASQRLKMPKEQVREEIAFLIRIGKVRTRKNVIEIVKPRFY
ncbi:hypothetical protein [Metallosphaera javensis (ex Sakai et al. 2022)]|uniref:hypothetical protein n=1 Tax=Metallosphaera javensis (ex Sakai et al. 2022) TaxID=2775498 RepID=UPI00258FB008|nr:MAG: hypothetical protein MjAS7_0241 [Metallosphaera javensis (ex Sakai et al. 2022)]